MSAPVSLAMRTAIFLISAAALGYEILLMRLLSIVQWHHFASMIISLALLGFGASGTFLTLTQRWLVPRFHAFFTVNAVLFALAAVGGFTLAQKVPFNPLEIYWNRLQFVHLLELCLLLLVPFFMAANCLGLAFIRFKDRIHGIYLCDLLGAGAGAAGVIGLLFLLPPPKALIVLAGMGFAVAALTQWDRSSAASRFLAALLVLCGAAMPLVWPAPWLELRVSEYKGLSHALRLPDARILDEYSSPLGWLTVVESPTIPFRNAPGLSLQSPREPPPQLGVFTDGGSLSPVNRYDGRRESAAYLDYLCSALPYHLLQSPKVLVLGAGGGSGVLSGLYHRAGEIHAVELNPQFIRLIRKDYADYAGHLYQHPRVRVHEAEARGFMSASEARYDLIQISMLDSFQASVSGGNAISPTYLYTTEAFRDYYASLREGGLAAVTRWLKMPPRDSLKLFATALTALKDAGVPNPERRLALIRSWATTTLLIKKGELSSGQCEAIRRFCRRRSFDAAYYPGMSASEANRRNVLERPYFYEGASALVREGVEEFQKRYKFNILPATDDRPYFFHFFKWETAGEALGLARRSGWSFVEWGYPVLVVTLVLVCLVSLLLILLPLLGLRAAGSALTTKARARILGYFLCLGLAFLFVEMTFIQEFTLFLSHPLYSVAVMLAAFLVFAGLGSGFSPKLASLFGNRLGAGASTLGVAVVGIAALALVYQVLLPYVFQHFMSAPQIFKATLTALCIAPLAFFMGMPFPLGLSRVAEAEPSLVPWAWAVNGCASVLSPLLATLLAIHLGFTMVTLLALALYLTAAMLFRKPLQHP